MSFAAMSECFAIRKRERASKSSSVTSPLLSTCSGLKRGVPPSCVRADRHACPPWSSQSTWRRVRMALATGYTLAVHGPFSLPPHFARFPLHSSNSYPLRRCVVGGWVEWGCCLQFGALGRGGWRKKNKFLDVPNRITGNGIALD